MIRRLPVLMFAVIVGVGCSGDDVGGGGGGGGVDTAGGGDAGGSGDNLAPSVELLSPAEGAILDGSAPVTFAAQVSDDHDAPGDLVIIWTSSRRAAPLSEAPANSLGGSTIEVSDLEPGEHVITVGTTDSAGAVGTDSVVVTVNQAPSAPDVVISPSAPTTGDDLEAVIARDADDPNRASNALTYSYRWFKGGAFANEVGKTLSSTLTTKGDVWEVRVAADDGQLDGPEATATVTINNAPPSCEAAGLLPTAGTTATALSCSCSGWADPDGDLPTDRCAFYDGATLIDDSGACTLDASKVDKGMSVECLYTPSDGEDDGEARRSPAVPILNAPPTAPGAGLTPTTADATTELTCGLSTPSTDADGDTVSYAASWRVNDHPVADVDAASIVAGLLLDEDGTGARRGDTVHCELRASDGEATSPAGVSGGVTLGNAPPSVDNVTVTTMSGEPAAEGQVLLCAVGEQHDPDGDSLTLVYTWFVNGEEVQGVTGANLTDSDFAEGDSVSCSVAASDGTDAAAPEASKTTATIGNSAPSLTGASLSPAAPTPFDLVTCTPEGWYDPDGDTPQYSYAWFQVATGGALVPLAGATGATLTPNTLSPGDALLCEVTPTDGQAVGAPVQSAPVTLVELAPTAPDVSIDAPSGAGGVVTCVLDQPARHFDGEVSYTYFWTLGGAAEASGAASRSDLSDCQLVSCRAEATDGTTTLSSPQASVQLPIGPSCTSDDVCKVPTCSPAGGCALAGADDGTTCSDGNTCTTGDICQSGACTGGGVAEVGAACSDGKFCTSDDTCNAAGECIGGPDPCADGAASCVSGVCDEGIDQCVGTPKPVGTACSDGDGCTVGDTCDAAGQCTPGAAPDCSWQDATCVVGTCTSSGDDSYQCVPVDQPEGSACEASDVCIVGSTCDASGQCVGGGPRDCDAEVGGDCLIASCDGDQGGCVAEPVDDGTPCDDDDTCTLVDTCQAGLCVGEGYACAETRLNMLTNRNIQGLSMTATDNGGYVTIWWDNNDEMHLRFTDDQEGRMNEQRTQLARHRDEYYTRLARGPNEVFLPSWERPDYFGPDNTPPVDATIFDSFGVVTDETPIDNALVQSPSKDYAHAQVLHALRLPQGFALIRYLERYYQPQYGRLYFHPTPFAPETDAMKVLLTQNQMATDLRWRAAEAQDGSGNFSLVWVAPNKRDVYVRNYLPTGDPSFDTPEPWLAHAATDEVVAVRVLPLSNSHIVVAWQTKQSNYSKIYLQKFTDVGQPFGQPQAIHPGAEGYQELGELARFADDGFVVTYSRRPESTNAWEFRARLYDVDAQPASDPILGNLVMTGDRTAPAVVVTDSGEWAMAFHDKRALYTRRFERDGSGLATRYTWRVNDVKDGPQTGIRAARGGDGRVMAVYESPIAGLTNGEILGRLIDPAGPAMGAERRLNTTTDLAQVAPTVAGSASGYAVAWQSAEQDGSSDGVFARWLALDGAPTTDEIQINSTVQSYQRDATVTMLDDGTTVFAWRSANQAFGAYAEVIARVFDDDGNAVTDEFQVNLESADFQDLPQVVHSAAGDLYFAWQSRAQDGDGDGIYMRRFDMTGSALSGDIQVHTETAGDQKHPTLALSPDGTQLITCWQSMGEDAASTWGVYCQRIETAGLTKVGPPQLVNALTAGDQAEPRVAYDGAGRPVVVWESAGVDYNARAAQLRSLGWGDATAGPRFMLDLRAEGDQSRPFVVPLDGSEVMALWQTTAADGSDESVHFRLLTLP